jgi:F-type H+-transporting ATPase subunit delta
VVENKNAKRLLADPTIESDEILNLFVEILKEYSKLNESIKNFLHLLILNRRLFALPEILKLFYQMRLIYEKTQDVKIITTFKLTDSQKKKFSAALKARFKCHVNLTEKIDKNLLGGAVVRCGNVVFDGSARTKLQRLKESLFN